MKIQDECFSCIEKMIEKPVRMATDNVALRSAAIEKATQILSTRFSSGMFPAQIVSTVYQEIIELTGNLDPYQGVKERKILIGRSLLEKIKERCTNEEKP